MVGRGEEDGMIDWERNEKRKGREGEEGREQKKIRREGKGRRGG